MRLANFIETHQQFPVCFIDQHQNSRTTENEMKSKFTDSESKDFPVDLTLCHLAEIALAFHAEGCPLSKPADLLLFLLKNDKNPI